MKIDSVRLVCFSPTRTTRIILENIAAGIGAEAVDLLDLTLPGSGVPGFAEMGETELLLIGAPVYAGRLPAAAVRRFQGIQSSGSPAVLVVLYGNREFEDALLELSDLVVAAGFVPVAGGAFIGEHSFSSAAIPLAAGRPDAADLRCAQGFGKSVGDYLRRMQSLSQNSSLQFPGSRPFREHGILPQTSPATKIDRCTACGTCASSCPTGSIRINDTAQTNSETCILCCACIRACPEDARSLQDERIGQIVEWLRSHTAERKEPATFLLPLCESSPNS